MSILIKTYTHASAHTHIHTHTNHHNEGLNAWNFVKRACRSLIRSKFMSINNQHLIRIDDDNDETNIKLITLNTIQWSISIQHLPTEEKTTTTEAAATGNWRRRTTFIIPWLYNSFSLTHRFSFTRTMCVAPHTTPHWTKQNQSKRSAVH